MSFLVPCPNCGPRSAYEFRYGGEHNPRPTPPVPDDVWTDYLYGRRNEAGRHTEWWYHRMGCRRWFLALRDTVSNTVIETRWPEVVEPPAAKGAEPPQQ